MDNNLGFGIKFFREEEHKRMFESGRLFSNPISYYRKHKQELGRGRGDSNEGILTFRPKEKLSVTLITEKGQSISGSFAERSIPLLEEQHIFSFTHLEKDWYNTDDENIFLKVPNDIATYFFENYGRFYSLFSVDALISSLNNTILKDGVIAYNSHFKIEYVDEEFLTSKERFLDLNYRMDRLEELEYEDGKPLFDEFYKRYMGVKSRKFSLEHEMRIIINVHSSKSNIIQI